MTTTTRKGSLLGLALALPFLLGPALAAEGKAHKLAEWKIGTVLFGDKLSKSDLKGKVVVIENWGVHCPPCIASLPHLAELDKNFRDKGLCIIGAESQGSTKDAIKPLIEKAKVEYTITAGADGPIEFSAIPRCFIFDAEGLLVYDGYPSGEGFDKAIKDSLKKVKSSTATVAATGPLIPTRAWTNSDGREIRAAVTKLDGSNVTFLLSSGKEAVYPMDKLSEDSRNAIAEATKPQE